MGELVDAIASWRMFLVALLVFGFAPGAVLRLIVLAYHRDDPRRREARAELHAVPRWERPLWVCEQLELAIFEGLRERIVWAATGRIIYRWQLGSGVERNRTYPDTFEIPDEEDKNDIIPGDHVRLMFEMRHWGERTWVDVVEVKRRHFVGRLRNDPVGIPKLEYGDTVRFKRDHIIDIHWTGDDDHDCDWCSPAESDPPPVDRDAALRCICCGEAIEPWEAESEHRQGPQALPPAARSDQEGA
jgi:hypothetical protein